MASSYDECVHRGLLRRMPPSQEKAERSLHKAEKWLREAKSTLKSDAASATVLTAYLAMFHAARSLLFRDGWREKSHVCVARYLEAHYVTGGHLEQKWVDLLDHHREVRHDDQYDLSFFSTHDEAEQAVKSATIFLGRMKSLLDTHIDRGER